MSGKRESMLPNNSQNNSLISRIGQSHEKFSLPGYETFSTHHVWGRRSPMFIHHILTIPSAMDFVAKQEIVTGQRQEIKGF